MQNLEKKSNYSLPTLKDDIMNYTIQDLDDPEKNKIYMICDRKMLLDLRAMRELLESYIQKDKQKLDNIAIIKMILEKM